MRPATDTRAAEPEGSPFDAMAAGYDAGFTESLVGRLMRAAVWERMDAAFQPGQRVIELGCGTGADALHLARRGVSVLATDASQGMVDVTRAKVAAAGVAELVQVARLAIEELPALAASAGPSSLIPHPSSLDGALSNFGALNCVPDLRAAGAGLAELLRPGAPALLCVMGPLAPWEWAWYGARGEWGRALRRLRPGGSPWRGLTISYPSARALARAWRPWFRVGRLSAVGALLPPSYAEPWARRRPALLWALARLERRLAAAPPLPRLADHYLIELVRR